MSCTSYCVREAGTCCNPHTHPEEDEGDSQLSEVDYDDFEGEENK